MKDGILKIDTKEVRKCLDTDLWSQQFPHEYLKYFKEPTWFIENLKKATDDWEPVLSYLASIVQQKKLKYVMLFVGPPSYGKSPYLLMALKLIGEKLSAVFSMDKVGEPSGMATIYDKILGVDEDMNMAYVKNSFFTAVKKLCGDGESLDIKLLYQDPFQVKSHVAALAGTNQTGKITQGVEEAGLYKRVYLSLFNKQVFADDDTFLDQLLSQANLERVFSYLMNYEIIDQRKAMGIEAFVKRTGNLWRASAYPVYSIMALKYQRVLDDDRFVVVGDVIEYVIGELNKKGIAPPQYLTSEITATINLLGGTKASRNKKPSYIGIIDLDPPTLEDLKEEKLESNPSSAALDDWDLESITELSREAITQQDLKDLPENFFDPTPAEVKAKAAYEKKKEKKAIQKKKEDTDKDLETLLDGHTTNQGGWEDELGNPIKSEGW